MLPMREYTELSEAQMRQIASLKLALVGLAGYDEYFPSEISGGMVKRAALARAMALDPEILFFDEPSAGLDPITSKRLDDLVHQLRDSLGSTIVMVTHELPQIYALSNNCIYLDNVRRTITAEGDPRQLVRETTDPLVEEFMTRGGTFPIEPENHASAAPTRIASETAR
jgi:phospholipid/cholesterol/gamma-HCH transport system ATP-binding protein